MLDLAGERAQPDVGLALAADAAAELEALVGEQAEREQAHHQARVGLGRVLRQRQRVRGVVVAIEVGDLQRRAVDGGLERHGDSGEEAGCIVGEPT